MSLNLRRDSMRFHRPGLNNHATGNLDRTHEYLTSGAPLIPSGENGVPLHCRHKVWIINLEIVCRVQNTQ